MHTGLHQVSSFAGAEVVAKRLRFPIMFVTAEGKPVNDHVMTLLDLGEYKALADKLVVRDGYFFVCCAI